MKKDARIVAPVIAVLVMVAPLTVTSPAAAGSKDWRASYTSPYQPPSSTGSIDPGLFTSVAALSPTSVLAAGFSYDGGDYFNARTPIIEQWDGDAWTAWDTGALPTDVQHVEISDIAARSLSDVWIATPTTNEGGRPMLAHYDGARWSTVTSEGLPPYWTGSLLLRGASTSIVGTVGGASSDEGAFIATYRASATHPRWSLIRYDRYGGFSAAVARTRHDAWAVGGESTASAASRSLVEHWNGKEWHRASVKSNLVLLDVAASSKASVMAIGAKNPINGARRALLWNGKRWSDVGPPTGKPFLNAVTTDPAGGYWASGTERGGRHANHTTYYRYAHGHWKTAVGPARTFPNVAKQGVSINDLATVDDSVWAVGFHRGFDSGCREGCADTIAGAPIVDRR